MSTSNNSNQLTLADSGANERPPMLKKGNYIPLASSADEVTAACHEVTTAGYGFYLLVIVNGDSVSPVASASADAEGHIPPQTAEQKQARKNELKAKSTLMLAIPDEHLLKFHACKDAKSLWEAIKNSLPSAWNNTALFTRNKSDLDTLSMDDLYNNLKLDNEDLKQIDIDDLEKIDLKWAPRNQGNRNKDASIRNAPVDTTTTNALVVQDGIESLKARIVVHEKNKAVYEEDISFLKYDVQVKDISIKEIKNQLENASKEKDDLKLKLEKFETSSKNLTKLINSQISAIDKTDLGYDGQMNESDLNNIHLNESEVLNNVFDSRESDRDDNQVNDRLKKGEGYHAVPLPYTRNYMPPRADLSFARLHNSVLKSKVSETITSVPKIKTNASKTSKDSLEKPKPVRSSAPLIEEWESDSKDENVFKPKEVKKTVKPSLEKIEFVNAMNTTVENENKAKKPRKFSQSPRGNKRNWNGLMTQKLGYGFEFKKKACFVCGSINHLIKDCDFYENKMVLNNKGNITGPKEIRPVWDNTVRVNHQNKLTHPHPKRNFVPAAILTKSGQVLVNAAKLSSHRASSSVSAFKIFIF
nr:ribonuclease H-like domain-containing protein [Tanacetum cinerariifolium]